jgi:hypothetical protein
MIDGPTPLHLFDAPTEGTGKTLLVQAATLVATGRPVEGMPECAESEEWRKRLTATLAEAPVYVFLDNINRWLDSSQLASAITARTWKDRVLGYSKNAVLPVTCVWLASGNNTRLSREMIRRTVWTRLDAKTDAPWDRTGFRHPNLIAWCKQERPALVRAALILCQAWIAAGQPSGSQTLGMFESWCAVIGGILDVAGVPGLMANAKDLRKTATDRVSEWRSFVASWWQKYETKPVGVEELFVLATGEKLLDGVLGDKGERSQRIKLGLELPRVVDRVFGEYRIVRGEEDHKKRQQYRLEPSGEKVTPKPAEEVKEWSE